MNSIAIAVLVLAVISVICGVGLCIASKFMAVEVDERIPQVRACLPGANCGACGFAGCDGYASALVEDPELAVNLCVPGGATAASDIGKVLGREAGETVRMVAEVRCSGTCEATSVKMDYNGIETCAGAKLLFGGTGACVYGCIGLGDCARVCPENAIRITTVPGKESQTGAGLARVDTRACIGCGLCAKTCPNNVIAIRPFASHVVVDCNSHQKGAGTRKACKAGCIGCRLCEKNCHTGAITVTDNLASIDYAKCDGCGKCIEVCRAGCLVALNLNVSETAAQS